jgi:hypothetical protein
MPAITLIAVYPPLRRSDGIDACDGYATGRCMQASTPALQLNSCRCPCRCKNRRALEPPPIDRRDKLAPRVKSQEATLGWRQSMQQHCNAADSELRRYAINNLLPQNRERLQSAETTYSVGSNLKFNIRNNSFHRMTTSTWRHPPIEVCADADALRDDPNSVELSVERKSFPTVP